MAGSLDRAGRIAALARDRLGFDRLRPGQLEGVQSVLDGRDTLCVMSTGSGKTAIYELAGMMLGGPAIVVSPLIALQRDQVDAIGGGRAVLVNSAESARERAEALRRAEDGEAGFLLLAPEQLVKPDVRAELAAARPALFVVDEAHCVSEWGHDFRPDYLELAAGIEAVGRPPVLALTATAAPPVRADIVSVLALADPAIVVRGFDRPNIHLAVDRYFDADHKRRALLEAVGRSDGPGLVYVATRHEAEDVAGQLRARAITALAYHGGLPARRREEVQDAFMHDRDCRVVVATVAFGMGVDKPNVRWVLHEDVSDSVDSYYQELGRAGRDGAPAAARLFYREEDLGLRRFFSGGAGSHALVHAADTAAEADHDRHAFALSRVEMMRAYAERRGCRRAFILGYFGEDFTPPCGNCDNCDRGLAEPPDEARTAYAIGDRVVHRTWGEGTVGRVEDGHVTVVFDSVGYKTLDAPLVTNCGLLAPAGS